jgi:hypothetical protein
MKESGSGEGLKIARFLMVLASISPLFVFWAIQGNSLILDRYFSTVCIALVVVPNVFLWLRFRTTQKLQERREIVVGKTEDHRDHLLVYLFAMLLPFYTVNANTWRAFSASLVALAFILFLFWHLNLHYMNVVFAALGYRVFTIHPPVDRNVISGRTSYVLVTRRIAIAPGERIVAYRLSDTVYFEAES